jgi:glycosyltransferase involved in cell wall biosynthesis
MKVALVHDWLTGLRGGEKCLEVLCRRFPDAELFTLLRRRGSTSPAIERMRITTSLLQRLPGIARHYRWTLPLMPLAVERLRLPADVDLVVSLSHAVAKGIRPPASVPHVCYCFTPARYVWGQREQYFGGPAPPGRFGVANRAVASVRGWLLDRVREWDRRASERVTHFVAISETVRERIAECYGRESVVIHPPVDTDFYTPAPVRREDFYLCVSALVPYKRVELAIETCNRLGRRLDVIGAGPHLQRLAKRAGPTVRLLGWRTNEEIRDRLRRCRALLFPGCEDFGIVPLEAQACGTPVIAFAEGGARETVLPADAARQGTGVLFHRQTPDALCEAIRWFERHRRQCSASLAVHHAARFNTRRFEEELIGYLTTIRERHRSGRTEPRSAAIRGAA